MIDRLKDITIIIHIEPFRTVEHATKVEAVIKVFSDNDHSYNRNLDCIVDFEDDNYIITNEDLDITVWGESRKEVEEAFCFSFYSTYKNFYLEDNINLSEEAIHLKEKLKGIIKNIINEAPKI